MVGGDLWEGRLVATILALDKDPLQLELLTLLLRRDRHRVVTTSDPESALALLLSEPIELALVETSMPRHDGYRLCGEILQARPEVALVIVSENSDESEVVRGLLAGADDYVAKPYSPRELLARVQVVLRRTRNARHSTQAPSELSVGEVSLNLSQLNAVINGRQVALTPREFSLLHALMANANRVLSRDQIMRLAWGDAFVGSKAVDVCIQRIRKKIQPFLLTGSYVHAVRGYGYKFAKPTNLFEEDARDSRMVTNLLPSLRVGASTSH